MKFNNVSEIIGNTPLILLESNGSKSIYAKLEGQNPAGSVKDRPAFYMISEAIQSGILKKGDTIVEATSGNTGIALAMAGNLLDINVILIMSTTASEERKKTMKAYGATLIEIDNEDGIEYGRKLAQEMADEKGYVALDQFNNKNNYLAHYASTGPEVYKDTDGKVTHFVSSMGTTGTIMGTSTFLKEKNNQIQIVGVQPEEGEKIPGIRKWSPEMVPSIFDPSKVDQVFNVTRQQSIATSRLLATKHGIFAGISSGGAGHVAFDLYQKITEGCIVFIVCDRGDRYFSNEDFV